MKDATEATRAANRAAMAQVPLADRQSFEDARRGFIEALGDKLITRPDGRLVWTLKGYEFLASEMAPDSVHPGLWRHARVNMANGLYHVTDRVYQLRGFDVSNMTIIEGDSGLIVIDPLISTEVAKAAMDLYLKHRPKKPVVAVIYSHSHVDHFGGVRGIVSADDVAAGKVTIWAPAGFMAAAVGENVIAGNAMLRRALFQFGAMLPRGERGQVDTGLGKSVSLGTVTLIPPTNLIEKPVETHRIDGVEIVFELTPDAEAPAELIMYYPDFRVLNMTEITTQNFHNLLPMRGALVRDSLAWSKYIGGALHRYGASSEILIAQHNWPVWSGDRVRGFLRKQRDAYKFVHDQTVRLMNHGYVGAEIAEMVKLPASLNQEWSAHSFYGNLKHNIRAIYQRYLGYYDGNPANLDALPPVEAAKKSVEYMGGAEAVLKKAREDLCARRVSLGRASGLATRVRRSRKSRRARACRRRVRAVGLPVGIGDRAKRVSAGRIRAAQRRAQSAGRRRRGAGHNSIASARHVLRLHGGAAQRRQGRRQDDRAQLALHRQQSGLRAQPREQRANIRGGHASGRRRRDADVDPRDVGRDLTAENYLRVRVAVRPDRNRWEKGKTRRVARDARRLPDSVPGRRAAPCWSLISRA